MTERKVFYADSSFEDLRDLENALSTVGATVVHGSCQTTRNIIAAGSNAKCIIMDNVILTAHSEWLSEDALKQSNIHHPCRRIIVDWQKQDKILGFIDDAC